MINEKYSAYTGRITYRDIEFDFSFDGDNLKLIPPDDKKAEVMWEWGMESIAPGVNIGPRPLCLNQTFLKGPCFETGKEIIFLFFKNQRFGFYNSILEIQVVGYIDYIIAGNKINQLSITCPEISAIHSHRKALNVSNNYEKGIIQIETKPFNETTTERKSFICNGVECGIEFAVTRGINWGKMEDSVLILRSCILLDFPETEDYDFIQDLCRIVKRTIEFLCYRKDIFLPEVTLYSGTEDGKQQVVGTLHLRNEEGTVDYKSINDGRYIRREYLEEKEGRLLNMISENSLYLRHIPEDYKSGRHYTAAKFIMIMAAFEWEYRKMYPEGVKKSVSHIEAENAVEKMIEGLIGEAINKKQKGILKHLLRLVRTDNLSSRINQIGNEYDDLVGAFGQYLYRINGAELKCSEMGKRLEKQRNNFAHGNLDQKFDGDTLNDIIYLEYLIYAMQLKRVGLSDDSIRKAINDLFKLNFAL